MSNLSHEDFSPDREAQQNALNAALASYMDIGRDNENINNGNQIVIIDYTQPSYRKRLYVYDFSTLEFEREHHCAHGLNSSDPVNKAKSNRFSDAPRSRRSSLGAMYTGKTYEGKHSLSLRLHGLEKGKNGNVYTRGIVIHGAYYCSDDYILERGRAGVSFGCPAVDRAIVDSLIEEIKHGTFVFAYGGEE